MRHAIWQPGQHRRPLIDACARRAGLRARLPAPIETLKCNIDILSSCGRMLMRRRFSGAIIMRRGRRARAHHHHGDWHRHDVKPCATAPHDGDILTAPAPHATIILVKSSQYLMRRAPLVEAEATGVAISIMARGVLYFARRLRCYAARHRPPQSGRVEHHGEPNDE